MDDNINSTLYEQQITAIVHGFIQVWNKFEATLSRELAQVKENLDDMNTGKESHPDANYELFYRVSSSIYGKSSLTMGELSHTLSVPLSTATRMTDRLVDHEYMQRLPDPEDRRIVRVALTENGRKLHKQIDNYVRQRLQQIFSHLSLEERTTLITLIAKLVASLKEEVG